MGDVILIWKLLTSSSSSNASSISHMFKHDGASQILKTCFFIINQTKSSQSEEEELQKTLFRKKVK